MNVYSNSSPIKMKSFCCVVFLLLATSCSVQSQFLGDPGMEPWMTLMMPACMTKNVNIQDAQRTAKQCIDGIVSSNNPMAVCGKQKERNDCVKTYYDTVKKCFSDKKDVDKAYEAQKAAIKYSCKDDMKEFKGLSQEDMQCTQKMQDPSVRTCTEELAKKHMPDMDKLFAEKNCKLMTGYMKCQTDAMKKCKTSKFRDFFMGQIEAITEETGCDMDSGAATLLVTPLLLVCLLSHVFFKSLF